MSTYRDHIGTVKLRDLQPEEIPIERLVRLATGPADPAEAGVYVARLSAAGGANIRFGREVADDQPCAEFTRVFMVNRRHLWPDEYIILVNQPCFLLPRGGAIVLADGRAIAETIYPSGEKATFHQMFGIEPPAIRSVVASAEGPCIAPAAARWSSVYYHFLAECLVHDGILDAAFPAGSIRRIAPEPAGAEILLPQAMTAPIEITGDDVVPAARIVTSTALYRYEGIGTQFRLTIDRLKRRFAPVPPPWGDPPEPPPRRLYVSRGGAPLGRKMLNEADVEALFARFGFEIVHPQGLTFAAQVALFAEAGMVAGPYGSGLTNAAFARPGATLYELRPQHRAGQSPNWDAFCQRITALMGLRSWVDVFPNAPDTDEWEADLLRIERAINGIIYT